jgi:hypothetical protein
MFRSLMLTALGAAMLFAGAAIAQDESILLDMKVNFGVAFRDASWVPVDVFVRNTERDVRGYVEVRTFDFNGDLQSPTYRLPAESARGSQKRFRLYCKLERVDRIEAQLYHGNRRVSPTPTWLQVTAIDKKDYLGLVLDDAHHDYGFLSDPVLIGRSESRFHREGLKTDQLGYLADHIPCYTAFDLIAMGNIDPENIGAAHRALIRQYVTLGGTLVVNLGANADRYKGTWVEELMGVSIGTNTFRSEPDLATAGLGLTLPANGISSNREGMVTAITPAADGLQSIGKDFALGSIRSLGRGRVATITVDAVSGLMQHQPDYLDEWSILLAQSIVDRPLNLAAVIQESATNLPSIAGVRLFPVSSVITYLLLYFFIAIVGNWFFWNWMKRREMAWVCLVFFSLAFTSYAMIFGTQGRARSTQLEQIEILELSTDNDHGQLHGITGLLAKGSGRFDATLVHPNSLLSDAARSQIIGMNQPGGLFGAQGQNTFHFVQGAAGRVTGLTVGASEMRFIQTEAPIALAGTIEADLTVSQDGILGSITNNTGLPLLEAAIFHQGSMIALEPEGDTLRIAPDRKVTDFDGRPGRDIVIPAMGSREIVTIAEGTEDTVRRDFLRFAGRLPSLVLRNENQNVPTCLIAWLDSPPLGSIDLGTRAAPHLGTTLAVAWLDVQDERADGASALPLPIRVVDNKYAPNYNNYNSYGMLVNNYTPPRLLQGTFEGDKKSWQSTAFSIRPEDQFDLSITLPEWVRGQQNYQLEITVTAESNLFQSNHRSGKTCTKVAAQYNKRGLRIALLDGDPGKEVALAVTGRDERALEQSGLQDITQTTYQLDNWPDLVLPRSTTLHFRAVPQSADGNTLENLRNQLGNIGRQRDKELHYHTHISARLVKIQTETVGD